MEIGGSAVQVRLKANPGHGVIVPNGAVKIEGGIDVVAVFHVQPDPQLSEGLYERLVDRAALGFQVQEHSYLKHPDRIVRKQNEGCRQSIPKQPIVSQADSGALSR